MNFSQTSKYSKEINSGSLHEILRNFLKSSRDPTLIFGGDQIPFVVAYKII